MSAPAPNLTVFHTVDEAAELYRVARSTITEHARRGRVPSVRFPGQRRILFPIDETKRFVADPCLPLETVPGPDGGRITRIARRRT